MTRRARLGLAAGGLLAVLAALVLPRACASPPSGGGVVRFTPVDVGVEYARLRVPATEEAAAIEGHAFRVDLEQAGVRVLPAGGPTVRRDVRTITRALPSAIAINGSFFDEEQRAMGLVVDEGRLISRRRYRAWGALVVKGRRGNVMMGSHVKLDDGPTLVLQGFPRLVVDGEVGRLQQERARRTAVCLAGPHDAGGYRTLTLVVTSSRVGLEDLAHFLALPARHGGMGCSEALNLDGGPSTQLVARLGELTVEVAGGSGVPNALAVLPGLPERRPTTPRPVVGEGEPGIVDVDAGAAPLVLQEPPRRRRRARRARRRPAPVALLASADGGAADPDAAIDGGAEELPPLTDGGALATDPEVGEPATGLDAGRPSGPTDAATEPSPSPLRGALPQNPPP